jgi:hypothetical protein
VLGHDQKQKEAKKALDALDTSLSPLVPYLLATFRSRLSVTGCALMAGSREGHPLLQASNTNEKKNQMREATQIRNTLFSKQATTSLHGETSNPKPEKDE